MLLHPEATEDPATLRWVTDTFAAPEGLLAGLIGDGVLSTVDVAPGEIRTRLAAGRSWAVDGPTVRTALFDALSSMGAGDLRAQIAALLDREVGPFVTSHGGTLEVLSVRDDVIDIALDGTCGSCTLRGRTLTDLVTTAVRSTFPQIREVRAVKA